MKTVKLLPPLSALFVTPWWTSWPFSVHSIFFLQRLMADSCCVAVCCCCVKMISNCFVASSEKKLRKERQRRAAKTIYLEENESISMPPSMPAWGDRGELVRPQTAQTVGTTPEGRHLLDSVLSSPGAPRQAGPNARRGPEDLMLSPGPNARRAPEDLMSLGSPHEQHFDAKRQMGMQDDEELLQRKELARTRQLERELAQPLKVNPYAQ